MPGSMPNSPVVAAASSSGNCLTFDSNALHIALSRDTSILLFKKCRQVSPSHITVVPEDTSAVAIGSLRGMIVPDFEKVVADSVRIEGVPPQLVQGVRIDIHGLDIAWPETALPTGRG